MKPIIARRINDSMTGLSSCEEKEIVIEDKKKLKELKDLSVFIDSDLSEM